MLNPIQPNTFIVDDKGEFVMDKNFLDAADVTSTEPAGRSRTRSTRRRSGATASRSTARTSTWRGSPRTARPCRPPRRTTAGKPAPAVRRRQARPATSSISKVDCSADGKTVTTTYSTPFADWKSIFTGLLPAHIVEQKTGVADVTKATAEADLKKIADFWNTGWTANGSIDKSITPSGGPYLLDSFKPGETLTEVRNDKYWGPPAQADTFVIRQIPDSTAMPQALANNEVQVIAPQPNEDLVAQTKQISDVNYSVNQGFTFEHFDLNFKNPVLADLAVRQAFALCINRQEIVDTLIKPLAPDAAVLNNRMYFPFQSDLQGQLAATSTSRTSPRRSRRSRPPAGRSAATASTRRVARSCRSASVAATRTRAARRPSP